MYQLQSWTWIFETQSRCPLETVHKFATHESTRALTCVVRRDGVNHRFGPYLDGEAKQRLANLTEGCVVAAHNAPFDEAIWRITEKLPDREWRDTLPQARAAGLPGKLEDLSKVLGGRGKDRNGKMLIDMLCMLKPGKPIPVVGPAHELLMQYNVQDVEELEFIRKRVEPYGEPDMMQVDRDINDRGLPFNRPFLELLSDLYELNHDNAEREFRERTKSELVPEGLNAGSSKQVCAWLERMGFSFPSGINKVAYKNFMADPEKFFVGDNDFDEMFLLVHETLEHRREIVRVGRGKVEAAFAVLEADNRIREQLVYWGAHTGRWAGRKLQIHNMPGIVRNVNLHELTEKLRYSSSRQEAYELCRAAAKLANERLRAEGDDVTYIVTTDILNSFLRHCVDGEGVEAADYGAVELRCTAWLAGASRMLSILNDPKRSLYLDMGEKLFGMPIQKSDYDRYALAKALVLGCNYGMSGNKFAITCKLRGVKTTTLEQAGITIQEAVKIFRTTYPEIPALWKQYHDAVHSAVRGVSCEAGRCKFYMNGRDLHIELPSGRSIVYRNARVEMRVPAYVRMYGMPEEAVPTVIHDRARVGKESRPLEGYLYGSKVCENVSQGTCRDLLKEYLCDAESAKLNTVFHVHDEAGREGRGRLREMLTLMSTPPLWASGFPLLVEGYSHSYWTKQMKYEGKPLCEELSAMNGRVL